MNIVDVIFFSGKLFVVRIWMTLGLFAPGTVFKLSINKNHSRHLEPLLI